MIAGPLYAAALEAGADGAHGVVVREEGGTPFPLPVGRWTGPLEAADEGVLDRAVGPVLDVGCGPGRHTRALVARGIGAVGVESAPEAVVLARNVGTPVLEGSIFDIPLAPGGWRTVLVLDGNIGIGGQPGPLLVRVAELLGPDGRALVELDEPGTGLVRGRVRLEDADRRTAWHPWARLGADAVDLCAAPAGLVTTERWETDGRWFVSLEPLRRGR